MVLLTGCSAVVTDKYYVPEWEQKRYECEFENHNRCKDLKEITIKIPECWKVEVNTKSGFNRDFCLPKDKWDSTYVGQEWE